MTHRDGASPGGGRPFAFEATREPVEGAGVARARPAPVQRSMAGSGERAVLGAAKEILAREAGSACLLDARGIIRFVNEAWDRFARENGGAPGALGSAVVGTPWIEHVLGDDVRAHHVALLERALAGQGWSGVVHLGECNSPTEARLMASRFERVLSGPGGEPVGIAAVHTMLAARPLAEAHRLVELDGSAYRHPHGMLVQCACCRRVQSPADPARWDLIPHLLESPGERVTHGLCELCVRLYYHL